jgi:hypothetical protein
VRATDCPKLLGSQAQAVCSTPRDSECSSLPRCSSARPERIALMPDIVDVRCDDVSISIMILHNSRKYTSLSILESQLSFSAFSWHLPSLLCRQSQSQQTFSLHLLIGVYTTRSPAFPHFFRIEAQMLKTSFLVVKNLSILS